MKNDVFSDLNALASLALNIANFIDKKGIANEKSELLDELNTGWGSTSRDLRKGVEAIAKIQGMYYDSVFRRDLAEGSEKDMSDFLEDMFGEEDPHCVNEEIKEKLRAALQKAYEEWDAAHPC